MPIIVPASTVETIEALDFSPQFPCEAWGHAHAAEWSERRACCGMHRLVCADVQRATVQAATSRMHHCVCQREFRLSVLTYVPLGGAL